MELSQPRRFLSSPWSSHKSQGGGENSRSSISSNRRRDRKLAIPEAVAPASWLEPLEQRLLYTQTPNMPMITEFLASNNNGLEDNHGHHSDWIEIYNPQVSNFDLSGYYLTDNEGDLTGWQFPAGTTLTGGSYMLVFASGDNEAVVGQPFHTNFDIGQGAGYLGLVAPDGVTVLSDYQYPDQITDTSYGIAVNANTTTFVNGAGALVKTFVPTENIGGGWRGLFYDDSAWQPGTTGVGYETDPPSPPFSGFTVRQVDISGGTDGSLDNISEAINLLNGTANPAAYTKVFDGAKDYTTVNFGGGQIFTGDNILPDGETNQDAPGRTQYAMRITAQVTIPVGQWTIDIGSDEGFRLRIPGIKFAPSSKTGQDFTSIPLPQSQLDIDETLTFGASRVFSHTTGAFTVLGQPLTTTIQLDYFERTGIDALEVSTAVGQRTFSATDFTPLFNGWNGWKVSTPSSGTPDNYAPLIKTDVKDRMFNGNTTAYMRLPFSILDASQWDTLRLRMKYDDGFVAYLNGVKIADRNAPASPVWNSKATQEHPDEQAKVFEDFDIPIPAGVLQNDVNILAIQGLNDSADSPDFLVMPELLGVQQIIQPGDRYMNPTPGALNSSATKNGVVADTKFSHNHGFYDAPFNLVITTDTVGAQIRYTTNGSAPTFNTGTVYTGPITINKTTTLRAAAFFTGLDPSDVDTQTYVFLDDVITQSANGAAPNVGGTQWPSGSVNGQVLDYGMDPDIVNNATWGPMIKNALKALPTINIAIDVNDMFGAATGIFTHPRSDGRAWERPASLELINPDGTEGFQINAGIRIRGGFSRDPANPKHGFRFFFRDDYGASKLKYPLFGNDPTATDEFKKIDFRTFQNYSWSYQGDGSGTFVRDISGRDLQLAMGDVSSHGRDYNLYINGQYWGIYQTDERPEAEFASSYYGDRPEGYDTVKVEGPNAGYTIEATDGDLNAWKQLWDTVRIPSTAQVDIFTPVNVEIGDVFTLTVTGKAGATASVSYTAQAATVADVTAGLVAAWNASTNPLTSLITAQNINGTVKLTGKAIGMPFKVSSSTTNGAGNVDTTQALRRQTQLTPSFVETGDIFFITAKSPDGLTTVNVGYIATAPNVANVTAGLAAAWNASTDPMVSGITAIDAGTSVILVADDSSVPFYVTSSAANGGVVNSQLLTQNTAFIGVAPANAYQRVMGNNPDGTRNPNYPILLDVDNTINYILLTYWSGNLDAPISNFLSNGSPNNFFCTRPRDGSRGFSCVEHDSEHTLLPGNTTNTGSLGNRIGPSPGTGWSAGIDFTKSNPQYFFQQLWNIPEFQLHVADKIRTYFFDNGVLTPASVTALLNIRRAELDPAVVAESARWGDAKVATPYTKNTWIAAFNNMMNNFVNATPLSRTQIVFNQLVQWNLYPKLPNGTVFNAPVYSKYGGNIDNGFVLTMTNPNSVGGTIYYTLDGSDPRMYGGEVAAGALTYSGGIPLNSSTTVNARIRYQTGSTIVWSAMSNYKFKYNLSSLHVTELNYNPAPPPEGSPYTADDFEYIELQNTGNFPLQLGGLHFDQGITFTFPSMLLTPGARTLVVKNQAAFESRYGVGLPIAGEYIGALGGTFSNNSEDVNLVGALNEQLIHFNYDSSWHPITNGGGYTLVVRDPNASQVPSAQDPTNPLSHSISWRPSNLSGGGPGAADPGINPESVVINEVVSNTTAPTGDWIELKNLTNAPIDIRGWFLSNSALDLKKYQIPNDTPLLQPNSYIVFNAATSFGNAANPGVNTPFDLDEVNGTDIYLTNNNGSDVAGYREHADFGASVPNVSFGRYIKSTLSTDRTDFTQLASPTPGANNNSPTVGPIVISEINYNPTAGGSEFVEIENLSETPIQLWDPANPNNTWKFLSGISFTFPTNTTIAGFGAIVLIPQTISIASFRTTYNVPAEVQIFQYGGSLDNGGEDLRLGRPLPTVNTPGGPVTPYTLADKLKYDDDIPWPTTPDGGGPSLQRIQPVNYGNDPANWKAGPFNGNPGVIIAPQRPPVLEVGANGTVIQGVAFLRNNISFTDVNAEQNWTGTVNWGDGSAIQNLTINPNKTFNLNHTFGFVGTYTVTVTITDSYPESTSDTFQVTVTASTPPAVNGGPDGNVVQGDTYSQSGSFTDPDVGQSWTGTVNWGDGGATTPITLNLDKTFNLSHAYFQPGNYTVTVSVRDNANVIGTDTFAVNVIGNSIPIVSGGADQAIDQGGTFSGSGSFTDANTNQTWSGTINWGDGSPAAPLTLNADKTFNLSHPYANAGTYTATITVNDNVGGSGMDTVIISVKPSARLGTSSDDTYILRIDPSDFSMIQFFENRTIPQGPSYSIALAAMDNYTFNGVGGNDTFIVDISNGNPIPSGGIIFSGGANTTPGDLLLITGSSLNDDVHITTSQIQIGGRTVDYSTSERIQFDGGLGNDTMTIDEGLTFSPTFNGGSGNDFAVINGGVWRLTTDAGLTNENLNIVANNDTSVIATATQHLASLALNNVSRFTVSTNGSRLIKTRALTMSPTAIFELFDNDLVLQATAANRDVMLTLVSDLVRNGRAGGAWNGIGIRSATAANNALRTTGLAVALNDQGNGSPIVDQFSGETVDSNSVLVKYTYSGDANLNGQVDADDYALIDGGFASSASGWYHGDFNLSGGKPNSDDYFMIDRSFADQGAPLSAAPPAAPAPAEVIESAGPTAATSTASDTRAAVKTTQKKHKHHKRNVLDKLEIEPRQILQRRRD